MADPKKNPLIGAFRAPVPGAPPGTPAPPEAGKPPAAEAAKPLDEKKGPEVTKAPTDAPAKPTAGKKEPETLKRSTDTPAKPTDEKKGPENPKAPVDAPTKPNDGKKEPEVSKVPADTPAKPASEKNGPEAPKAPVDTSAKPAGDKKEPEVPKPTTDDPVKPTAEKKESSEPPKAPKEEPAKPKEAKKAPEEKGADKKEPDKGPELRFVALSKIKPLPGTYVKDEPRKDYSSLIADIQKNGLKNPVILRQSEKEGEFQLVEGYEKLLSALTSTSPVPITEGPLPPGVHGAYHHAEQRITLSPGMSQAQTVKTLVHEIAHAKLHALPVEGGIIVGAHKKERRTREVEAESVAYTVCQYLGLDTGDYSFGYIAGWSSGKEQKELRSSLECIRNTAAELIDGIERQCLELPPPEPVFQRRRKQTSKRTTKPQTR